MATGENLAVTRDGEVYNKLKRPDDYHLSVSPIPPPLAATKSSTSSSSKRKREQDDAPENKRARATETCSYDSTELEEHARDTGSSHSGLRPLLPGLDQDEQPADSSMSEALAYLRSVRSEASAIPTLLVAPHAPDTADSDSERSYFDDYDERAESTDHRRLVYKEGFWVAVDNEKDAVANDDWDEDLFDHDPQQACNKQLLKKFQVLRSRLVEIKKDDAAKRKQAAEKKEAVRKEDAAQRKYTAHKEMKSTIKMPRSKQAWAEAVDRDYPVLLNVIRMEESALYLALHGCILALSHSTTITHKMSCWVWTLLALAGEVGTLDNDRISKIRELATLAGRLRTRLQNIGSSSNHGSMENAVSDTAEVTVLVAEEGPGSSGEGENRGEDGGVIEPQGSAASGATRTQTAAAVIPSDSQVQQVMPMETMDGDASGSDAKMMVSENEDSGQNTTGNSDLEQARARLLAQLGDRLVQPGISSHHEVADGRAVQPKLYLTRAEAEREHQKVQAQKSLNAHVEPNGPATPRPNELKQEDTGSGLKTDIDYNTKASIDMMLTVAVELYGQKDLVEYWEAW